MFILFFRTSRPPNSDELNRVGRVDYQTWVVMQGRVYQTFRRQLKINMGRDARSSVSDIQTPVEDQTWVVMQGRVYQTFRRQLKTWPTKGST